MKISIIGSDSLARVIRECCSAHFDLGELGRDLIWFCEDTPIENDEPKNEEIYCQIARVAHVALCTPGIPILISSQIPVGTIARLEEEFPAVPFAYSPENIRVAHGVADFSNQSRVVVGRRDGRFDDLWRSLFAPFTNNLILTDPETAECCKHALNCWLGMTIAYSNEIAKFCKAVGADPTTVSKALLAERRISPHAPMKPGAPYGGGHLARDIYTVNQIARWHNLQLPIISHIKESNEGTS